MLFLSFFLRGEGGVGAGWDFDKAASPLPGRTTKEDFQNSSPSSLPVPGGVSGGPV